MNSDGEVTHSLDRRLSKREDRKIITTKGGRAPIRL
jgi:hypothetical protein